MSLQTKQLIIAALGHPVPRLPDLRPVDGGWPQEARRPALARQHMSRSGRFEGLRRVPSAVEELARHRRSLEGQHPRRAKASAAYDCHQAEEGRPRRVRPLRRDDRHDRHAHGLLALPRNGVRRSSTNSHHAKAGNILASLGQLPGRNGRRQSRVRSIPTRRLPARRREHGQRHGQRERRAANSATAARSPWSATDGSLITDRELKPDPRHGQADQHGGRGADQTQRERPTHAARPAPGPIPASAA